MTTIDLPAAPEAALPATELLQAIERPAEDFRDHDNAAPKQTAGQTLHGVKHFPYARLDRNTIRRTKRLGPAFSLSTMRQVYPDEDSSAGAAA